MTAGTPYLVVSGSGLGANPVLTVATPTNPGDGLYLIANANSAVTAVSDSRGNTWVQLQSDVPHLIYFWAATYKGAPGTPTAALGAADTISITCSNTGDVAAAGCGGLRALAADANPPTASATSTTVSEAITPGSQGDMILMGFAHAGTPTVTYNNGFTAVPGVFPASLSMGYLVAPAAATVTAQATLGSSVIWIVGTASFAAFAVARSIPSVTARDTSAATTAAGRAIGGYTISYVTAYTGDYTGASSGSAVAPRVTSSAGVT